VAGNIAQAFEAVARREPRKPVLICGDVALDWRTLDRRAGGFAARLAGDGVKSGDSIALTSADPVEVVVGILGGLKAGAAVAPLNPRLSSDETRVILAELGPQAIYADARAAEADRAAVDVDGDATGIILFTSGSTARPKGALLSHDSLAFGLQSWIDPVLGVGPDDVTLSALPLAHSLGIFGATLAPLLAGGTVAALPRFSPEDALAAIARHGVTVFPGVATMFRRVLDVIGETSVPSLRRAISGAAPCPWELAEAWRGRTGTRIVRGYGMTELYRPISFWANDPREQPDAIGLVVPGVEARLVQGELWIKSPARLTGYLNQPEATAAVLQDGWFKTGDLASISNDGFVRIIGRVKDIILRGGYTVSAGEVEQVLLAHPAIAEAAVVGAPHAELGEEVVAFVAFKADAMPTTQDDVIAHCKAHLANYKYPRAVRVMAELPKGATGKIQKSALRV
jgi:long-chain acyl-CoA synthetase